MNAWCTLRLRVGALAVAVALVAAAVTAGEAGASAAGTSSVPGAQEVSSLLRGIPQRAVWLGRHGAPLTLVEYVDVQCLYCARFSRETLPTIVRRYVRSGRVRILFRGMAFLGPDSTSLLRWTLGAGRQDKLWNVLELLFINQGAENSGWATQARLAAVARSVPGLAVAQLRRDSKARWVAAEIRAAAAAARKAQVPGTPYFEVGRSLTALQPLQLKTFDPADLSAQLDRLLTR